MKDKEKIRNYIIEVAERIFVRLGFDRTTMEIIAREARKGKSTLYYYFKNKEELFEAVIRKEANFILNELLKIINQQASTKEIFKNYVKRRYELLRQVLNFYHVVKYEDYYRHYPEISKFRHKYDQYEVQLIKQILLKGIDRDEIKLNIEDVDIVALTIISAMRGLEEPVLLDDTPLPLEEKIGTLVDLLFDGLAKK